MVDIVAMRDQDTEQVLRLAAGAERVSEHPLARAVVAAAEVQGISAAQPTEFQATAGKGITAQVNGHRVVVSSPRFVESSRTPLETEVARQQLEAMQAAANTVAAVATGVSSRSSA